MINLRLLLYPIIIAACSVVFADAQQPARSATPPSAACNRVRFEASSNAGQGMVGSRVEGSNVSRTDGFVTLATITEAPKANTWAEVTFDNKTVYRWLRFIGPRGKPGKLGKVEFYAGDRMIAGEGKAINYHLFVNDAQDEQSIGYDVLEAAAQRPAFKPDPTEQDGPVDVTITSNRDSVIRYTLDGSWPTATHGEVYEKPVHLEKTTTISAAAFLPDRAPGLLMTGTYLLKGSSKPGLNTAHIGNSLTGTTGGFWRFARTAGYDHRSSSFLRPGALTRELWALASGTFASDKLAAAKEKLAQGHGSPAWDEYWGKIGKVDMLTLQPRDFDLEKELAAEIRFIKLFRGKSPDLQPWLYCEWVEQKRDRPSDHGAVPSHQMNKTFPALTWEESMGAMLLYVEELQHRLGEQLHDGKRARIIPAALAMGWIKNKIDHGQFGEAKPGTFYQLLFNDQVHPADAPIHGTANGAYLVDMTWFSAFYREAPEGRVLPIETTFTRGQARIVERLAWDVIKNYPDCGLYEEGTQPCATPKIERAGGIITLSSSTPGAWFRYTLDGTTPTRTRGYVYCGVISMQPGIQVKAVAYRSGMADSTVATLASNAADNPSASEDWGAYSIVPASAQGMVLEAVGAGTDEGTAISINKPAATANQKWVIAPKGGNQLSIRPASNSALVLAVAKGGTKAGTSIVLEKDSGQPWQLWSLRKRENGSYNLTPKHAPGMGLDHLGGKQNPGAKIDLWQNAPNDQHLQWMIKPLAGSTVPTATPEPGVAKYEPPDIKPADVLPGAIKQFPFTQSKIFPGTARDVTVFIPAQYDGSKPACVYVKTDGYNPREKELMETLIATREMPVTIGVFVRPGELPAPMKGTVGRRNRDFEYDGVSDNHVRFLVDELLPFVAKEFSLKLSADGNDRCMAGGSSGGIAAFTAAWDRPDAFSRVYAASGSWVAFRGGHEFPTMVRKFEARPIRAFLTTATKDMENCAGDWFLMDQEMDKALKFSGYDYQFRIIDGHHVAGYIEHWREAMAYLWKGWPERVKAGPSAPRAQDVLVPGEPWQLLAEGFKSTRGPACNASGDVFFADTTNNRIHRIDHDGTIREFVADSGSAHCLTIGADGKLYTVSEKSGKLMSYDSAGAGAVVMDGIRGHSILARPDGGLYVTSNGDKAAEAGSVWLVKDGKTMRVDTGMKFATGMAYRPDQWLLSVADGHSKWAYSCQVNADGTLANKERFFWLHVADWEDDAGAESMCYALEGQLFVATRSGVQICADDGPTQVILPVPDRSRVTGVCLGGKDMDTLFAFCGNKIWKRKVKVHAMGAFTPWTSVMGTKL